MRVINPQYSALLMVEGLVTHPAAPLMGADPNGDQAARRVKLQNPLPAGSAIRKLHLRGSVHMLRIAFEVASLVSGKTLHVQVKRHVDAAP